MRRIGIFEAKTKLSEICESVAESGEAVTVTRRGKPLVRILPLTEDRDDILTRRQAYLDKHGHLEEDDEVDFSAAPRSRDIIDFDVE